MIREAERETEPDVTCIAFLQWLSGFTVRLIQLITSFPLSSTIAARVLIVYPSEKVILRCQVQHRKWLCRQCLVMTGPIAGISEVDQ